MGTEVLRPQEFFVDPQPSFHRRKSHGNLSNFIVNRKPYNNNNRKKVSSKPERNKSTTESKKKSNGGLEMGQVTLLRRGESLGSLTSKINLENSKTSKIDVSESESSGSESPPQKQIPFDVSETRSSGSESPPPIWFDVSRSDSPPPEQIRLGPPPTMYAGSACFLSPSPRFVPLPSFFNNFNKKHDEKDIPVVENSGTIVLRRLLRLE